MKRTISAILLHFVVTVTLAGFGAAQEPATSKPRPPRTTSKPAPEASPKSEAPPGAPVETPASDEQMLQTITNLTSQLDALNAEIKLLRQSTERNSIAVESLLSEERLTKLEDKLDQATQRKIEMDAREADIQRRQRNIQQEVTARGFLRRDEGEAMLRTEFQRALDDTHSQQQQIQQRIADLQGQVTQARARAETLRRRLDRLEGREEGSETKQ